MGTLRPKLEPSEACGSFAKHAALGWLAGAADHGDAKKAAVKTWPAMSDMSMSHSNSSNLRGIIVQVVDLLNSWADFISFKDTLKRFAQKP